MDWGSYAILVPDLLVGYAGTAIRLNRRPVRGLLVHCTGALPPSHRSNTDSSTASNA